jgi:hypothetical protein
MFNSASHAFSTAYPIRKEERHGRSGKNIGRSTGYHLNNEQSGCGLVPVSFRATLGDARLSSLGAEDLF